MKIAFLVDKVSFGGGERILKMLIDEFCKLGHQVYIYSYNEGWKAISAKYYISILHYPPIGLKGKVWAYSELKRELKVTKPDCLITFDLGFAEVAVWAAKSAQIPILLSERCDPRFLPKSKLHRILKFITYQMSSGIVFQTNDVLHYFPKFIKNKGVVIPNPIMDDDLPPVIYRSPRKEIVAAGRLSKEKNFGTLIQAFALLNAPNYILNIYGVGEEYASLMQFIQTLQMQEKIFLKGQVSRLIDNITGTDIFVLSSNHEGMPNVLLEAMAMGIACVSTDFSSGGARAVIQNEENGLLVPVNDVNALKIAIERLITCRDLNDKIRRNAQNIRKTHSKERILPLWINYIQYLTQKN